jgi:hypothetical protein
VFAGSGDAASKYQTPSLRVPHLYQLLDGFLSGYNQLPIMKLNLKKAFQSILEWGGSRGKDEVSPVSMVLLLREPKFFTLDQLRQAAERAYGTSFAGGKESRHCVVQAVMFTLMKAGPHMLSFLNNTKPYGEGDPDFGISLPQPSQQRAWGEHTAWTAVDYVKGGVDFELEHAVLAKLCAEMIDPNCVGLYVPGEHSLVPNDGSLSKELRKIAVVRRLGVT